MDNVAWGEHTRRELEEYDNAVVLLPTGAVEQHGAHLPVDTDAHTAAAIATAAAERTDDTLVLPPLSYGYSPHHRGTAGTLTLSSETYLSAIRDLLGSAADAGFEKLAVVNGHGGNRSLLRTASSDLRDERNLKVAVLAYWNLIADTVEELRQSEPGGVSHAGEMETSLQRYLREELVDVPPGDFHRPDRNGYLRTDLFESGTVYYPGHYDELTETGASGSPSEATMEMGEQLFDAAVVALARFIEEYRDWR